MHRRLLPSGRVRYLPMSEVVNDASEPVLQSLLSGERTRVQVRRKVVDATVISPEVPATHTPHGDDDAAKNRPCTPVPLTHTPAGYRRMLPMNLRT